jgi:hypothetical protein
MDAALLELTKSYVLLQRGEVLLSNTSTDGFTELELRSHVKTLKDVRDQIARTKNATPGVDFEILATALTYWDPEMEKLYPNITDWSVLPE